MSSFGHAPKSHRGPRNGAQRASAVKRMTVRWLAGPVAAASLVLSAGQALADPGFDRFVNGFWPTAKAAGISSSTYKHVFRNMEPDPDTLKFMDRQSEFVKPVWDYLDSAVSESRITRGKEMMKQYSRELAVIEERYGVDREAVLAIWGMETNYGSFMGKHNVIRALATLVYAAPRRTDFWRSELIKALGIVQAGHVRFEDMEGSWAGAMGHTQFMPSSWQAYAADYDGDGRRDIWTSVPDALASTARYLKEHGWQTGKTWGYEVRLPQGFNFNLADEKTTLSLRDWDHQGVKRVNGRSFPRPEDDAILVMPAGAKGPAFLMLRNFFVIKRYNNATAYALGVGHLADRINGGSELAGDWAREYLPLNRDETAELQHELNQRGYHVGTADGIIGPATRAAIRAYQKSRGIIPDGYASVVLLARIKMDG